MAAEHLPIRPEVVDLLMRAGLDRELVASATSAELQAALSQMATRSQSEARYSRLFSELGEVVASIFSAGRTLVEAIELLDDENRAKAIELLEEVQLLGLLVDPKARTTIETAEEFLAGRLVVTKWAADGQPMSFEAVEADPDRAPLAIDQVVQVLVSLVGEPGARGMMEKVPEAWKRHWFDQKAAEVIDHVIDEGVASGWLSENTDGTLDGDLDRLNDELGRAFDRLGNGDDEP